MRKIPFFFSFLFLGFSMLEAQEQKSEENNENLANFDCGIVQTKQKLDRQYFASTPSIVLRVNNSEYVYATLQFGKREDKIFMYIRIADTNVCIEKDKVLDLYFKSGEVISYKNDFALNCEGYFAKQLSKKDYMKLQENEISLVRIYAYGKNYELYVSEAQNYDIDNQLNCLAAYHVKKTDEVKIKKQQKQEKNEPASGT
ncbi:hypothetical protein VUJ46_19995 [Chryseobacterium sp. MYb264]|uniref:hypothetical protein n=1 Tax=Chryseobacterium sp. MYb264 TaxID=2745153 RepID=UPI002E1349DF|nr:hypothetical protein VUJ46_19995 [Chryseobacterium sp. MYb264]